MTLAASQLLGRVVVRDGCLVIQSRGAGWIPIWPRGYELVASSSGSRLVADRGGGLGTAVGGRVTVFGCQVIPDMSLPPDCQRADARFFAVTDVGLPDF